MLNLKLTGFDPELPFGHVSSILTALSATWKQRHNLRDIACYCPYDKRQESLAQKPSDKKLLGYIDGTWLLTALHLETEQRSSFLVKDPGCNCPRSVPSPCLGSKPVWPHLHNP